MTAQPRVRGPLAAGTVVVAALALALAPAPAPAGDAPAAPAGRERALRNDYYRITLDHRARMELADQNGLEASRASTFRTLLGLETAPWRGLSGLVQLENNTVANEDRYFATTHAPNGKTAIADPRHTSLNQARLRYQNDALWGLDARAGRQAITYDDHRFVGDVGWRQNMQTFDAARVDADLGIDELTVSVAYLWQVLRIFDDQGPPANRDFDSTSPLLNVSYAGFERVRLSAFAYLLDFDDSPVNSADSYGLRATGRQAIGDDWWIPWAASYAYQTDAARNPTRYHAHYANAEAGVGRREFGRFEIGYELLGSDDGRARFVTPLATAHKFNGWADVFVDNGGVNGLQDLYFRLTPELPCELEGHVAYHRFWSDDGSDDLGEEWDAILSRAITPHVTVLTKLAVFNGREPGPDDLWRYWIEATFRY